MTCYLRRDFQNIYITDTGAQEAVMLYFVFDSNVLLEKARDMDFFPQEQQLPFLLVADNSY